VALNSDIVIFSYQLFFMSIFLFLINSASSFFFKNLAHIQYVHAREP